VSCDAPRTSQHVYRLKLPRARPGYSHAAPGSGTAPPNAESQVADGRIRIFVVFLLGLDAQDTGQRLKSLVMACHQSMGVQTRRRHRRHIAGLSWACAPAKSTDGPVAHAISLLSIAAIVVPSKAKISQIQQASESRWPIFPIGSKFKVMPVPASLLKNGKNRKHSRCSPSPRSERFPCRLSLGSEQPPNC
jgi:hypothetical protein